MYLVDVNNIHAVLPRTCNVLFDTGAQGVKGNYLSAKLKDRLKDQGITAVASGGARGSYMTLYWDVANGRMYARKVELAPATSECQPSPLEATARPRQYLVLREVSVQMVGMIHL